jgi:hypothetical protein
MTSRSENKKEPGRGAEFLPRTAEVIIIDEQVKFDGNIVPHAWLHNITDPKGRADVIACMVLAEIVYWYRGADVVENGKVIGRKRKFDGDYLQKSYGDLAAKLNLTKGQVTDAIVRLEKRNLIKREFRTLILRGIKTSNVLFVRLFAWQVCHISNMPTEKVTDPDNESEIGGYGENSGDHRASKPSCTALATDTSTGPAVDKYREYDKDHPEDHTSGQETSTSAEPAEPAPTESFSISGTQSNENSPPPGSVASNTPRQVHVRNPESAPRRDHPEQLGSGDPARIRRVLEQAFNGQKFNSRDEAVLQSYIAEGRVTLPWAEAFSRAKLVFDQDRARFKAQSVFIPVKPMYLIKNFDLTSQGILTILGEQHSKLEAANSPLDREELEPSLKIIAAYDRYFEKEYYFNAEYRKTLLGAGGGKEFDQVLVRPERFLHHEDGDAIPPVWLRIVFAHRRGVCTPGSYELRFSRKLKKS